MATIASSLQEIKTTLAQLLASTQTFSLDSLDQLRKKDPDRADGLLATHIFGISEDRQKKIIDMAETLRVSREKAEKEKKEEGKKKEMERKETERKVTERKEAESNERERKERAKKDIVSYSPESYDFEKALSEFESYGGRMNVLRRRRQRQLYTPRYYDDERQGYDWYDRVREDFAEHI